MTPKNAPLQTEHELLLHQERTAKLALQHSLHAAWGKISTAMDPRVWTETHPWKTTGIAALAGFVVATQVTAGSAEAQPSPGESHSKKDSHFDAFSFIIQTGLNILKTAVVPWAAKKISNVLEKTPDFPCDDVPKHPNPEAPTLRDCDA